MGREPSAKEMFYNKAIDGPARLTVTGEMLTGCSAGIGRWRPVEPGTFPLAHGPPSRVGRLRAYGNAIVAQAAEAVIASYLEYESEERAALVCHSGVDEFEALLG